MRPEKEVLSLDGCRLVAADDDSFSSSSYSLLIAP
jgi:hypothetical protein